MNRTAFSLLTLAIPAIVLVTPRISLSQQTWPPDTLYVSPDTSQVNELEEIVITGTRVSKKIIDIPYSVVRLNFQNYQYDRKIGPNDVMPAIPGLFLQSRYGNHDVRFSIRGFGSRSNSGIRGVRILLDDIPESEPDGQTRIEALDFNSIGRIEIVKGNASSLYTNAPGGVANFFNDIDFHRSSLTQFNQFGSFGLHRNGLKAAVRTDHYGLLATYSYQNYEGFRAHNNEWWNIFNLVVETNPSPNSTLKILGYFVDGKIRLPGSLTKEEFDADPWQADQRSIDRDEKRITTKGRIGIRFNTKFGRSLNNELEITAYGTNKYFERTAKDYRIINRDANGFSARYTNLAKIGDRTNEFSIGTDIYTQPARIENYENINGMKGDQILQLQAEKINNIGFYFTENFEILKHRLFVLLTGRYDHILYDLTEETLPSRNDTRTFGAFTPKLALNYKLTPWISAYTSFGLSYDSPANNEMDSPDPEFLYNQDLKPQKSLNYEIGIKGNRLRPEENILRKVLFEATFFNIVVNNEIVPYEVLGDVFYRNAAETHRMGLELGAQAEILRGLDFTVSYTYSHFRYDAYTATTIEIDSAGNFIENDEDFSGNAVPSIPVNNIYLALSYSHALTRHIDGFVKTSFMGIDGLWVDDANTDKTDAFNLLNAVLGFDMSFGSFSIMLSGGLDNIFDAVYVGFTNTNSANKRFYEAGAPRNYYLALNLGYTF
jgi:iron complex outermembrane receptor protein